MYGVDMPERFKLARRYHEQYYEYDYQEIVQDDNGWAIDVQTQTAAHLRPKGLLLYANGRAYDDQPVIDTVPAALTKEEISKERENLKKFSGVKHKRLMDTNFKWFVRNKTRILNNPPLPHSKLLEFNENASIPSAWDFRAKMHVAFRQPNKAMPSSSSSSSSGGGHKKGSHVSSSSSSSNEQ